MNNKTIVFVQNVEYPQQWAVDIFYYSKYLAKDSNYDVKVIVSKINEYISSDNLEVIELWKINYFSFILKSFLRIKKIKNNQQVDYVYFFAQHPFSVLFQFVVKYILRIKTIYDVVSWPIWRWIIPFISKYTIKVGVFLSDKYVVLDKNLISTLKLSKNKPYEVIWMWYNEELFYEKKWLNLFNKKDNEIVFTYIWTLDKERNLDIFINAFIENIKKFHNIKLYFIWFWSWEKELKRVSWEYLNKHIFFLWKQNHKKIPDYINSSDILVSYVPKVDYFEFQPPTKLIEYLACNKPVLVTNTIAQKEIMNWLEYMICKDDFDSLVGRINYLFENINIIKEDNYKILIKDYLWSKLIIKIKKLIN